MAQGARFTIRRTAELLAWLDALRDRRAGQVIAQRLSRFERGLFGDVRSVGGGVSEARVDVGPGYRVYYVLRGEAVVLLLCGGDKASQARDIATARAMAAEHE